MTHGRVFMSGLPGPRCFDSSFKPLIGLVKSELAADRSLEFGVEWFRCRDSGFRGSGLWGLELRSLGA